MTITAALCWYDEEPATLHACIASLAGVVDTVVALDGRWWGFQGTADSSPPEQHQALEDASYAADLPLIALSTRQLWPSQVVKRAELLRLAAASKNDWILVIDADERIERCVHPALAAALDTELDVAVVSLRNTGPGVRNLSVRWARRLLRAVSEPRCVIAHNYIQAADGRWLAGDEAHVRLEPAADATTLGLVNHVGIRPAPRQKASELHYTTRREAVPA